MIINIVLRTTVTAVIESIAHALRCHIQMFLPDLSSSNDQLANKVS